MDDFEEKEISEHFGKFAVLSEFKLLISNVVSKRSETALKVCINSQSAAQEHNVVLCEENCEAEQVYSYTKAANNGQGSNPLQNQMTNMSSSEYMIAQFHERRKKTFAEECEKEMEEVRRKYNHLILNEDQEFNKNLQLVKELKSSTQSNKFLSDLPIRHSTETSKHGGTEEFQGLPLLFPPPGMGPSTIVTSGHVLPACMQQSNNPSQRNLIYNRQMENLSQKFPKKAVSKMLALPSSSNPALPFFFHRQGRESRDHRPQL